MVEKLKKEKSVPAKKDVKAKAVDAANTKSIEGKGSDAQERIAVIRIRGTDDVNHRIEDTMRMLKLHKKHTCSIYDKNPVIMGMLVKCKDYVTYGEIDEETYKLLLDKRAITINGKVQNYFHLSPPRGGFERRGIKYAFAQKGALGYRKDAINKLLRKMI